MAIWQPATPSFDRPRPKCSLEETMAAQSARKLGPSTTEIPDRLYFRIGDVARLCGVEPYVLRFWETQFPALKPNKGGTGQRLYRRREVELALRIKQLVHQDGYTLAGARQALEGTPRPRVSAASVKQTRLALTDEQVQQRLDSVTAAIGRARAELREISRQLALSEPTVNRRRPRLTSFKAPTDPLFPL